MDLKRPDRFLDSHVSAQDFMTWDNLHALEQAGWEITSHTQKHVCNLTYYTPPVMRQEFLGSKKVLQQHGFFVHQFVMPCAIWPSKVPFLSEASKDYYASYRSNQPGINPLPIQNAYNLYAYAVDNQTQPEMVRTWIESAKAQKGWLIVVFHQIDRSHQKYAVTPTVFEKILQVIEDSHVPVVRPDACVPTKQMKSA